MNTNDKEKATVQVGIRITPTLKEALDNRADEESRTLSNLIVSVLQNYIEDIENAKNVLKKGLK